MPPGVALLSWELRQKPVTIIGTGEVVTDAGKFARMCLEQLRIALANPRRRLGWTAQQLLDRLGQVGVGVAIDTGNGGEP
jgi:hypothetical protein